MHDLINCRTQEQLAAIGESLGEDVATLCSTMNRGKFKASEISALRFAISCIDGERPTIQDYATCRAIIATLAEKVR